MYARLGQTSFICQWCTFLSGGITQWITTRKFPIPQRLPAWYGIVTSNTSELIHSMIDEL